MSSVVGLERLLSLCSEQLAVCARELADRKLLEKERGVYRLGEAIASINEVLDAIYESHPDLKPELWGKPPSDEQFEAWYEDALKIAEEYSAEGQLDKAVRTLENLIFIGAPESIAARASIQIDRLRSQRGV